MDLTVLPFFLFYLHSSGWTRILFSHNKVQPDQALQTFEQGLPCAFILFGSAEDAGVLRPLFAPLKAAEAPARSTLSSLSSALVCPLSDETFTDVMFKLLSMSTSFCVC